MSSDHWTGRVIDGRYVVESTLGQGGMGVVLRARHRFTNAQVALKMLQPDLVTNHDVQERFLAEARAPSTIGHPGIVQVLDAGKTAEGELYLVMELLAGRTLRHAMRPPPPPQVTRRIVLELLDALGAAHARGIVHRDLKPENVFLVGAAGTVKLLDFGIAKVVPTTTRVGAFTTAGAVLGTLAYMAPEQLSDASSVDERADLWAVGVMLYELLSGYLPYRGASLAEIMQALATQEPDPIAAYMPVTPAIAAFFERALARDRSRRFGSAQEMALAVLALAIDGTSPAAGSAEPSAFGATVATGHLAIAPGCDAHASSARPHPPPPPYTSAPPSTAPPHGPPVSAAPPAHGPPTSPPPAYAAAPPGPTSAPPGPSMSPAPTSAPPGPSMSPAPRRPPPGAPPSQPPPGSAPNRPAFGAPAHPPPTSPPPMRPTNRPPTNPPPMAGPPQLGAPAMRSQPGAAPGGSFPWVWLVIGAGGLMILVIVVAAMAMRPDRAEPIAQPSPAAEPRSAQELCQAGCSTLEGCSFAGPDCVTGCTNNPAIQNCMRGGTCQSFATCVLALACNGVAPSGTAGCAESAQCEVRCAGNDACICNCIANMSPTHSIALARLNVCSVTACGAGGDLACTARACAEPLEACSDE
jgi:serine/threonine-protein kinase